MSDAPRPARDGETLSDEQTPTGGDPIMGALSMFGSYIRCGDSWDSCAQQAYDRAESTVAALRAELADARAELARILPGSRWAARAASGEDANNEQAGRARQETE